MTFVILFVIFTFAVPLALEIYQRGSDNVLMRSGREIMQSRLAVNAAGGVTGFGRYLKTFADSGVAVGRSVGSFAAGVIALVVLIFVAMAAWQVLSILMLILIWLIKSLAGG